MYRGCPMAAAPEPITPSINPSAPKLRPIHCGYVGATEPYGKTPRTTFGVTTNRIVMMRNAAPVLTERRHTGLVTHQVLPPNRRGRPIASKMTTSMVPDSPASNLDRNRSSSRLHSTRLILCCTDRERKGLPPNAPEKESARSIIKPISTSTHCLSARCHTDGPISEGEQHQPVDWSCLRWSKRPSIWKYRGGRLSYGTSGPAGKAIKRRCDFTPRRSSKLLLLQLKVNSIER